MARTYYRDSYGRFASGPGGRRGGGQKWKGSGRSRRSGEGLTRREGNTRRVIARDGGRGAPREASVRYYGGRGTPGRRGAINAHTSATTVRAKWGGGTSRPRAGQQRVVMKSRAGTTPRGRNSYIVTLGPTIRGSGA